MIVTAVSCPNPPLLLPGITGGPVTEVERLRSACIDAVSGLGSTHLDVVAIVGAAEYTRRYPHVPLDSSVDTSGFTCRSGDGAGLPLALAVGRILLHQAGLIARSGSAVELHGIGHNEPVSTCRDYGRVLAGRPERTGLLVMADGSARRGPKAPGYIDDRAVAIDTAVETSLEHGDPAALLDLEPGIADELLIAGRAAWQVLAGATEAGSAAPAATLHYSATPYGVYYPVATWTID